MKVSRSTKSRHITAVLALRGMTIRSWATRHGFGKRLRTVYAVINGQRSGAQSPDIVAAVKGIRG